MSDEILFTGSYGVIAGIISGIGAYFGLKTQIAVMVEQRAEDQKHRAEDRQATAEFRSELREYIQKLTEYTTTTFSRVVFQDTCIKCEKGHDATGIALREAVNNLDARLSQFISDMTQRRFND